MVEWQLVVCLVLLALFLIVPLTFYARDLRHRLRLFEYGEHTHGWLVRATQNLSSFDREENGSAAVLLSPDPATNDNTEFMVSLAERVAKLAESSESGLDPTTRTVAELMTFWLFDPGRRDRLPDDFTGGREVYLVHVSVRRKHLPDRKLDGPRLPCVILWEDPEAETCSRPVSWRWRVPGSRIAPPKL